MQFSKSGWRRLMTFSIRTLAVGTVSLAIGSFLCGPVVDPLIVAADHSVEIQAEDHFSVQYQYVSEQELTQEEKALLQAGFPRNQTNQDQSYTLVYRPVETGILPQTGGGSKLAPLVGLSLLAIGVSVFSFGTKKKKVISSILLLTGTGLALQLPAVSAVESNVLSHYNQTISLKKGDLLPEGAKIPNFVYLGYIDHTSSSHSTLDRSLSTSKVSSNTGPSSSVSSTVSAITPTASSSADPSSSEEDSVSPDTAPSPDSTPTASSSAGPSSSEEAPSSPASTPSPDSTSTASNSADPSSSEEVPVSPDTAPSTASTPTASSSADPSSSEEVPSSPDTAPSTDSTSTASSIAGPSLTEEVPSSPASTPSTDSTSTASSSTGPSSSEEALSSPASTPSTESTSTASSIAGSSSSEEAPSSPDTAPSADSTPTASSSADPSSSEEVPSSPDTAPSTASTSTASSSASPSSSSEATSSPASASSTASTPTASSIAGSSSSEEAPSSPASAPSPDSTSTASSSADPSPSEEGSSSPASTPSTESTSTASSSAGPSSSEEAPSSSDTAPSANSTPTVSSSASPSSSSEAPSSSDTAPSANSTPTASSSADPSSSEEGSVSPDSASSTDSTSTASSSAGSSPSSEATVSPSPESVSRKLYVREEHLSPNLGTGDESDPYHSFKEALEQARDGDEVILLASAPLASDSNTDRQTFAIKKNIIINGQGHALTFRNTALEVLGDVIFKDLTLDILPDGASNTPYIYASDHTLVFDNVSTSLNRQSSNFPTLVAGANQGATEVGERAVLIFKNSNDRTIFNQIVAGDLHKAKTSSTFLLLDKNVQAENGVLFAGNHQNQGVVTVVSESKKIHHFDARNNEGSVLVFKENSVSSNVTLLNINHLELVGSTISPDAGFKGVKTLELTATENGTSTLNLNNVEESVQFDNILSQYGVIQVPLESAVKIRNYIAGATHVEINPYVSEVDDERHLGKTYLDFEGAASAPHSSFTVELYPKNSDYKLDLRATSAVLVKEEPQVLPESDQVDNSVTNSSPGDTSAPDTSEVSDGTPNTDPSDTSTNSSPGDTSAPDTSEVSDGTPNTDPSDTSTNSSPGDTSAPDTSEASDSTSNTAPSDTSTDSSPSDTSAPDTSEASANPSNAVPSDTSTDSSGLSSAGEEESEKVDDDEALPPTVIANQDGSGTIRPGRNNHRYRVIYFDEQRNPHNFLVEKKGQAWSSEHLPEAVTLNSQSGQLDIPATELEDEKKFYALGYVESSPLPALSDSVEAKPNPDFEAPSEPTLSVDNENITIGLPDDANPRDMVKISFTNAEGNPITVTLTKEATTNLSVAWSSDHPNYIKDVERYLHETELSLSRIKDNTKVSAYAIDRAKNSSEVVSLTLHKPSEHIDETAPTPIGPITDESTLRSRIEAVSLRRHGETDDTGSLHLNHQLLEMDINGKSKLILEDEHCNPIDAKKIQWWVYGRYGMEGVYNQNELINAGKKQTLSVDADGTVTALKTGNADVYAFYEGKLYKCGISILKENETQARLRSEEASDQIDYVIDRYKIKEMATTFDKVKAVHDYMVVNIKYDPNLSKENEYIYNYTAYGAMVAKIAICEGYAKTFRSFMEKLGISTNVVRGFLTRNSGSHVWNQVKLDDGQWYHVDTTWDAQLTNEASGISYKYFLKDDGYINQDHGTKRHQAVAPAQSTKYRNYPVGTDEHIVVSSLEEAKASLMSQYGQNRSNQLQVLTVYIRGEYQGTERRALLAYLEKELPGQGIRAADPLWTRNGDIRYRFVVGDDYYRYKVSSNSDENRLSKEWAAKRKANQPILDETCTPAENSSSSEAGTVSPESSSNTEELPPIEDDSPVRAEDFESRPSTLGNLVTNSAAEVDQPIDNRTESEKATAVMGVLTSGPNKNVSQYTDEEGRIKTIIWAKGITPPLMKADGSGDFKREETQTSTVLYRQYRAPFKANQGWYDSNKSDAVAAYETYATADDRNLCFAATAANMLHWWLDQNKAYVDQYLERHGGEVTRTFNGKEYKLSELRVSPTTQTDSKIYELFQELYKGNNNGGWTEVVNNRFLRGNHSHARQSEDGFFSDLLNRDLASFELSQANYDAVSKALKERLMDNQLVGFAHNAIIPHIITVWGAEYDSDGHLSAIYTTDSDDQTSASKLGMERFNIYNHQGKVKMSSNVTDTTQGASYIYLSTLSLGTDQWQDYLKTDTPA